LITTVFSTEPDTISGMCMKVIDQFGSRLDQLIYGVAVIVHSAVCNSAGDICLLHSTSYGPITRAIKLTVKLKT